MARADLTPNQRAWVDDLRSGNRTQITGYLARKSYTSGAEGFCCLGVLSELSGCDRESGHSISFDQFFYEPGHSDDLDSPVYDVYPPMHALRWLGVPAVESNQAVHLDIPDANSKLPKPTPRDWHNVSGGVPYTGTIGSISCAELNDSGLSFAQIADMVEYFGLLTEDSTSE